MNNIIRITEYDRPELDVYARLKENQLATINEPDPGVFIAESEKVIQRALDAGYEPLSYLINEKDYTESNPLFVPGIPVYAAGEGVFTQLTGYELTRGMLCAMRRKRLPLAEEAVKDARRVCVIDEVQNPTNIGAIFRSAAALGIDAVLLTKGSSDPLYRRAIRVSMGNVFQIPWTFVENAAEIKRFGFKTAAMALKDDSITLDDSRLKEIEKLAIVMGTEGEGLSDDVIESCDFTVIIPMYHEVDSLNVAAASAVAFWELCKKPEGR